MYMSKRTTKFYVVNTNSNEERQELVQYIASKHLSVAVVGICKGAQSIYISTGDVWFVTIVKKIGTKGYFDKLDNATHFESLHEFIEYLEGGYDER